jgi:hypothetical protein
VIIGIPPFWLTEEPLEELPDVAVDLLEPVVVAGVFATPVAPAVSVTAIMPKSDASVKGVVVVLEKTDTASRLKEQTPEAELVTTHPNCTVLWIH